MCVCVYGYSVWAVSKSTVVKSLIIQLPTAVIIEDKCSVGPRLRRPKVNILGRLTLDVLPTWVHSY